MLAPTWCPASVLFRTCRPYRVANTIFLLKHTTQIMPFIKSKTFSRKSHTYSPFVQRVILHFLRCFTVPISTDPISQPNRSQMCLPKSIIFSDHFNMLTPTTNKYPGDSYAKQYYHRT